MYFSFVNANEKFSFDTLPKIIQSMHRWFLWSPMCPTLSLVTSLLLIYKYPLPVAWPFFAPLFNFLNIPYTLYTPEGHPMFSELYAFYDFKNSPYTLPSRIRWICNLCSSFIRENVGSEIMISCLQDSRILNEDVSRMQ